MRHCGCRTAMRGYGAARIGAAARQCACRVPAECAWLSVPWSVAGDLHRRCVRWRRWRAPWPARRNADGLPRATTGSSRTTPRSSGGGGNGGGGGGGRGSVHRHGHCASAARPSPPHPPHGRRPRATGAMAACTIDAGDTAWMLLSTLLVLGMMPALAFFEAGLLGAKNTVSILTQIMGSARRAAHRRRRCRSAAHARSPLTGPVRTWWSPAVACPYCRSFGT